MSGKLPPRKIAPRLGSGFGLGLVLGWGAIFLRANFPRTEINMQQKPPRYSEKSLFIKTFFGEALASLKTGNFTKRLPPSKHLS